MKHINLRLADDLHARLKAAADNERRSLNAQIAVYLERAVCADQDLPDPPQPSRAT